MRYSLVILFILYLLITLLLQSCCRPATEIQMQKFYSKYKFEAPHNTWGLHIHLFQKKNTYHY